MVIMVPNLQIQFKLSQLSASAKLPKVVLQFWVTYKSEADLSYGLFSYYFIRLSPRSNLKKDLEIKSLNLPFE